MYENDGLGMFCNVEEKMKERHEKRRKKRRSSGKRARSEVEDE